MPLPIDDYNLFRSSLNQLSNLNMNKSNGIMAFLALKHDDGRTVPSINSGHWATSKDIEDLFDNMYMKNDPRLGRTNGKVFKILNTQRYQLPTTSNKWRNILATQKGIVCYAPTRTMNRHAFLLQSYQNCPFRHRSRCTHNPHGQECINVWVKLLQKRSLRGLKSGFRRTEWSLPLESQLFSDSQGNIRKIPIYPLIVAIYFGSSIAQGRDSISIETFKREFHLSNAQLKTFFDAEPSNPYNAPIATQMGAQQSRAVHEEMQAVRGQSEDYSKPPPRVSATVSRIIRNTPQSDNLKVAYNFCCQICGKQIHKPDGSLYAEAHHIRPLGEPHRGHDNWNNMIVLCPNHHAEFDYGAIAIDPTRNTVLHINQLDPYHGQGISLVTPHTLAKDNLEYHLHNIFGK